MQQKYFSIIVVSLNPGERLKQTIDSILMQTDKDYEIILKDGGSTDGTIEKLSKEVSPKTHETLTVIQSSDTGIYDGMNQALQYVNGKYVQFLNCGDTFTDCNVLQLVHEKIEATKESEPCIFYGNQYNCLQNSIVTSVPKLNDFACYRNVPCHQVCFYDRKLFVKRGYNTKYNVRADYEHFLYSVYEEHAKAISIPVTICNYEGGGYSETKENRKRSNIQHKEITKKYLGGKVYLYRLILLFTFSGLRSKIAQSKSLSKYYNKCKTMIYQNRK